MTRQLIAAIGEGKTVVLSDGGDGWWVVWYGVVCNPTFNSQGAAQACLDMYQRGQRRPEVSSGTALWCHHPRHETPCRQPCAGCKEECSTQYLRPFEVAP